MRDDAPVELTGRYLDALVLLVREEGRLVSKDRFFEEVWRGAPVTDEALTQCIRALRRKLGDNAASPRFIATEPKHGYRFVAPVTRDDGEPPATIGPPAASKSPPVSSRRQFLVLAWAGTIGAGVAGICGGLLYGFVGASEPGMGAVSALLVLLCVTILIALIGGAGVAFGIAAADYALGDDARWNILGGAAGGLIVGSLGKVLGVDAFNLLFGQAPGNITGGGEGALLGAAAGVGAWLAKRGAPSLPLGRRFAVAALTGGAAGAAIPLLGGRMLGGSLDLLARGFPDSRLRLDQIGGLFGESEFGPISQVVTGGVEGALFAGCLVAAMIIASKRNAKARPLP